MANRKNTFLLKRSNVVNKVPSLGDIQLGEIALNTADAKLFSTYTGGLTGATEIREIGWDRLSTISGGTVNGDVTINANLTVTGDTQLVNVSGTSFYTDYIDFNNTLSPLPTDIEGRIYWDSDNGTLSLGMEGGQVIQQIGLEHYYYIKNQSGATIDNGRVVRAAGTLGSSGRILGEYMIADGTIPAKFTLGIATENILNGEDGYVTEFGLVRGIDASGSLYGESWSGGTILYVSPTIPGGLTSVEPTAPDLKIEMAIVIDADANGSIFVRPSRYPYLYDIQQVNYSAGTENNLDILQWNSSNLTWDKTNTPSFSGLTVFNNINHFGNYILDGNISQTGNYNVTGNTTQIGNINLTGDLGVIGNTNQTGNLNLTGNTTQIGNVDLNGNVLQNGDYDLIGSLDITGNTTQTGNNTLTGNLTVTGLTELNGLTTVYGNTPISAAIQPGVDNSYDLGTPSKRWREIYTTNIDVSNAATIQYLNVNATSEFYDTSNFYNGGINITGNTNQIGDTTQLGSIFLTGTTNHIGGYLHFGNTFITGNTSQIGNFHITGNTSQEGIYTHSGDTFVTGNTTQIGDITLLGDSFITGDTTQIGNFIITGDTIQNGDVDLTGNVTQLGNYDLVGNLNITGDTTQSGNTTTNGTVDIIGSGTGCTFSVTGKTCLDGNLDVTGDVNVIGNLTYDGNLIITGATTITSGATITSGLTTDTLNISSTPTENNDLIQILGRNSSTGDVEYRDVKTIGNNITVVTGSTYSATTTDDVIGIDSSTITVTLYLPDSVSSGRLRYDIKDIGVNSFVNPITVQAAGSDTIITTSVVSSFELSADGGAVILVNTGTGQWWQM